MGDYSSLGQQSQNFSQSSAFAAALQRAKQVCIVSVPLAINAIFPDFRIGRHFIEKQSEFVVFHCERVRI